MFAGLLAERHQRVRRAIDALECAHQRWGGRRRRNEPRVADGEPVGAVWVACIFFWLAGWALRRGSVVGCGGLGAHDLFEEG